MCASIEQVFEEVNGLSAPESDDIPTWYAQRNRQIGLRLAQARTARGLSVSECAARLATSRRRYRAIEQGSVGVSVPELEVLLPYLGLTASMLRAGETLPRQVVVQAQPGELVQVQIVVAPVAS